MAEPVSGSGYRAAPVGLLQRRGASFAGLFGPGSQPIGRNGIVVWKADGVTVQDLAACNFLGGDLAGGVSTEGVTGEQIWWNGGYDSGHIGLHGSTCGTRARV